MITHLDHVTVVVQDVEKAKEFFKLLGFEEGKNVTISGEKFEKYINFVPPSRWNWVNQRR